MKRLRNNVTNPPPPPAKIEFSIIYADDHRLMREAICGYINAFAGFKVVGSVADGKQLITLIQNGVVPDIVILDIEMPVLNGYDTAKWVALNFPEIKILMLTAFYNEMVKSISLSQGAHAFRSKNIDLQEMKDVLNQLAATANVIDRFEPGSLITENEQLFLKWICTNKTYEEIADCMNISLRQVERIRENLFDKLKVNSRTSLAVFAINNGVVTS